MAAIVMDGKALAAKIKNEVRCEVETLDKKPGLAVIIVGEDPASQVYVNGKRKDCQQCGIYSEEYVLPERSTQEELLELIGVLNGREDIDGILVQHPLPEHLDEKAILLAISKEKDVDCFHPYNIGQVMVGEEGFKPCTPAGVMRILQEYGVEVRGKECVIVGRSNIVGKPMAMLLLSQNGTVTICHTKTRDLKEKCLQADILVAAAGRAGLITADMVKPGAVVVDVAINRNAEGKLCGDVAYDEVAEKASYITPVPGGVGPVTRAMLMESTLLAARRHGK